MKQTLSILSQTVVLVIAAVVGFFAGAFAPSLRISHVVSQTATNVRTYDFDWLGAVLLLYVLLLLIGLLRKRIRSSWVTSTIALALAVLIVVFFTKIGFKDSPIY